MKRSSRFLLALALAAATLSTGVSAHFRLVAPASWLIESDRGDPQKAAPCGLHVSPLRGASDHRRSVEALGQTVAV